MEELLLEEGEADPLENLVIFLLHLLFFTNISGSGLTRLFVN